MNTTSTASTMGKTLAALALAAAGLLGAGAAQARTDVHWTISIPGPIGVAIGNHPGHFVPAPVYVQPVPVSHYRRGGGWGDADRDGVPNRYDRLYNPRWDRDGDGVPNRYDRYDDRHDRHDDRRGWRGHR